MRQCQCLIAVRGVAALRQHQQLRSRNDAGDTVNLLQCGVLVIFPLYGEHRAADASDILLQIPVPESRVEPDIIPAPECRIGICVIARQ